MAGAKCYYLSALPIVVRDGNGEYASVQWFVTILWIDEHIVANVHRHPFVVERPENLGCAVRVCIHGKRGKGIEWLRLVEGRGRSRKSTLRSQARTASLKAVRPGSGWCCVRLDVDQPWFPLVTRGSGNETEWLSWRERTFTAFCKQRQQSCAFCMKPSPKSAVTHSFSRSHHVQVSVSCQSVRVTFIRWPLCSYAFQRWRVGARCARHL